MFQAWEQKQERLQAMRQEQLFLRKCGHLEEILTVQEAGALDLRRTSCSLFSPFASWGSGSAPIWSKGGCVPPQSRELQKEECLYRP